MPKARVLFLCTGNSARSQMAEGLLGHFGGARFEAHSAGIDPKGVNPLAIRVMGELGVDIRSHFSKPVTAFADQPFDFVVTVCDSAREQCPIFSGGAVSLHWSFSDPAAAQGSDEEKLGVFRKVRDQIAARIRRELLTN